MIGGPVAGKLCRFRGKPSVIETTEDGPYYLSEIGVKNAEVERLPPARKPDPVCRIGPASPPLVLDPLIVYVHSSIAANETLESRFGLFRLMASAYQGRPRFPFFFGGPNDGFAFDSGKAPGYTFYPVCEHIKAVGKTVGCLIAVHKSSSLENELGKLVDAYQLDPNPVSRLSQWTEGGIWTVDKLACAPGRPL